MALFSQDALNDGVRKREVFGWAMYDFANSGYTTVVLTAVFAAYFVGGIANKAEWATFAWTAALSLSYAIVMLTMPTIGAYADLRAAKKRLLMIVTAGCVVSTFGLAVTPFLHGTDAVVAALALIVVSNAFYSYGESLTAAFLPELAKRESMGTVSGWGWSLGYFGGMLTLGLSLAYVFWAQSKNIPASEFVPVTVAIAAVVYALAALITFTLLKERAVPSTKSIESSGFRASMAQLNRTFHSAKNYRDFMWLLAATVAYQAGVAVAITLAAIYAEQVIGFVQSETMVLIFVLNIAAAIGAFGCGYLQDKLGHKFTLNMTLIGWVATCVIAALATSKGQFWVAATLAGLCMGSSQSAGRAMVGLFAPPHQLAEFFGLWSFSTRLASIIGPITYGAITWIMSGNQRTAIMATGVMFLIGIGLIWPIDMKRGREAANLSVSVDSN